MTRERGGELVGECTSAPRLGFCYASVTPTSDGFRFILGRVAAGLPRWNVTLLAEPGGSYKLGEVTEVQGQE